jgi:phosphate transport system substrate-binding protein
LVLAALTTPAVAPVRADNGGEDTPPVIAPYVAPEGIGSLGGTITADGSSTVWPMTLEAASRFAEFATDAEMVVEFSGTGAGFTKFCEGGSDVQNASRPISPDEVAACAEGGVGYYAFTVAFDGIAVVVHPANDFVSCLTVAQLEQLWRPEVRAETWQDLDPSWPDRAIDLWGPGPLSGTFDYFTAAILGEEDRSTTDYEPSEDDSALVEGVADREDALGYFGLAYYEQNAERLKLVAIDGGNGCVLPTPESIADGTYTPLARPLYVYVRVESLARSIVLEFLRFYLAEAKTIAIAVGYVPLPDGDYAAGQAKLVAAAVGNLPPDGP